MGEILPHTVSIFQGGSQLPALGVSRGSGSPSFLRICPSPIKTQRLVGLSGNRRWPVTDGNDGVYWSLAGCAQNRVHALIRLFEPQGESAVQSWVVEYVTSGPSRSGHPARGRLPRPGNHGSGSRCIQEKIPRVLRALCDGWTGIQLKSEPTAPPGAPLSNTRAR